MSNEVIKTLRFNPSKDNYRDLIKNIRDAVKEEGRFSHHRPVLPPRNQVAPEEWVDLVLSTDESDRTITLRIRRENLYLDGYKNDHSEDWYEFRNSADVHLIPRSTFLGFDGSYDGLSRGGGGELGDKVCSRQSVLNAINGLSKSRSDDKASHLMLLIVVVCEASRFEKLSNSFADAMRKGEVKIDELMVDLIHGWGDLSGMMLEADAMGGKTIRLPENNKLATHIRNPTEAADYVGLLLGSLDFRRTNVREFNITSSVDAVPQGQPLVEVLSVRVLVGSKSLSGTITVTDGLGSQTLYESDRHEVKSGETLALRTLDRAISAGMFFEISHDILSKPGQEYWSIFQVNDSYGREITTTKESIALSYVIFPDAWQLTWAAKIVSSGAKGKSHVSVYGSVDVSYTYNGTKYETTLFSRVSGDRVEVPVGGNVPLLRLAGAAPVGVEVAVEVSLLDHEGHSDRSIAKGRDTFRVGVGDAWEGSYETRFAGADGSSVIVSATYSRVSQPPAKTK